MITFLAFAVGYILSPPTEIDSTDVYGEWITHDKKSIVEISDCGDGTPCGQIKKHVTQSEQNESDSGATDAQDALVGTEILSSFEKSPDAWKDGQIFDPKKGRTYRATISREDQTTLSVKGCKGPICKGFRWKRAGSVPD